jgi:plasmid stabilization system protein ParE
MSQRASGSIEVANRVIDALADSLFSLGQYPQIGRRRDHDLRPGVRSFSSGAYVIIYRVEEADAVILHIMRGSRDLENLLGE